MTKNTRIAVIAACTLAIVGVVYLITQAAAAEHLDEDTIHRVFAEKDRLLMDTEELKPFLQARLDDGYVSSNILTRIQTDKPEETLPVSTKNKTEEIAGSIAFQQIAGVGDYERKILEIKYSDDKKIAYVSNTLTASGIVRIKLPSKKTFNMDFTSSSGCVDAVTLVNARIVWLRTDCKSRMKTTEQ